VGRALNLRRPIDGRPEYRKELNTEELKKVSDLRPKFQMRDQKTLTV
jgi:hypothetical protein